MEGKDVWIAWKRGSKNANKGETKKVHVSSKIAVIGENITILSTLIQDEKTKKFDEKKLELTIKMVRLIDLNFSLFHLHRNHQDLNKRVKPLGTVVVDLGEYGNQGDHDLSLPIKFKKKPKEAPPKPPSMKVLLK